MWPVLSYSENHIHQPHSLSLTTEPCFSSPTKKIFLIIQSFSKKNFFCLSSNVFTYLSQPQFIFNTIPYQFQMYTKMATKPCTLQQRSTSCPKHPPGPVASYVNIIDCISCASICISVTILQLTICTA